MQSNEFGITHIIDFPQSGQSLFNLGKKMLKFFLKITDYPLSVQNIPIFHNKPLAWMIILQMPSSILAAAWKVPP